MLYIKLTLTGAEFCSWSRLTLSRLDSSVFNFQQPMNVCCDMIDRYTDDDFSGAATGGSGALTRTAAPAYR